MALAITLRRLLAVRSRRTSVCCAGYVTVSADTQAKVAVLSMERKPVNGLSLEFLTEMARAIEKLETEGKVNGLIVTSSIPRIYSAGLDITEMVNPDPERLAKFWRSFQELWIKLYGSSLITVAAINGNSLAGGCLLSLMCDYRIMAQGKYRIGLSGPQLGISPTSWIQETMINTIGHREAEKALNLGYLFTTEEALRKNLVDELVPEEKLMETAMVEIQRWLQVPDAARRLQKQRLRGPRINSLLSRRDEDIREFCAFTSSPPTQAIVQKYLENLRSRKKN